MKWLFVGNFQSNSRGSYTVSEQIGDFLQNEGYTCQYTSTFSSKIIRVFQYLYYAIFTNANYIHMDIFSGRPFLVSYYITLIFNFRGKEVYGTLHGGKLIEYLHQTNNFEKLLIYKTLLCPSFKITKYLKEKNINVKHQPNPVNVSNFPFNPVKNPKKIIKLLWVRAFSKIYNPNLPIHLIKLMKEKNIDVQLTMIGPDSGFLKESKKIIFNNKLGPYIKIIGKVKNEELSQYFKTHHIFLSTSSYESFGMSIIEAALSGIAVVTYPTGEIPYIWTESEISFARELNSKSYYASIKKLLYTENWNTRLILARDKAEKFKQEKIMKQWIKIIENG